MSLFQASELRATISAWDLKMRFEIQFSRMNCQTFSTGLSSGALAGNVPAGLIEQHQRVGARRDLGCDLIEMQLHHGGVAAGKHEPCADAARRTDGAEDIG